MNGKGHVVIEKGHVKIENGHVIQKQHVIIKINMLVVV